MIVSFCFTIKIINSMDDLEIYQKMISKSIECAKIYHKVKLYTDAETLKYLEINNIEIELIDTSNFYFVDDFKVHLLSIISDDEILIDTDLFLFRELKIEKGFDAYFDFMDNSKKFWYTEYLKWFIDNGIREMIPTFGMQDISVPNIGIIKIDNKELKKEYIELYNKIKKWVLSIDSNITRGVSIILGQYLLALLLCDKKYKVSYCYRKNNHYSHLSGPLKFEPNVVSNIKPNKYNKII